MLNVEVSIFIIICLVSVEELIIIVFMLLVLVMSGIGWFWVFRWLVILCCSNVVILVELVNIILCMWLLFVSCVFMVFFWSGSNCIMSGGIFVFSKMVIFCVVISGVCFVGFVSMLLFVVSVVVICLVKIVSGKFYGLIYIIGFNGWWVLLVKLFCICLV